MSERSDIAERIANVIRDARLTNPFGGDVEKGKRSYDVLFATPRLLDGLVQVFGPTFILVHSEGPLGKGRMVFANEANAIAFIKAAFVDCDSEAAYAIPVKPEKQRKGA